MVQHLHDPFFIGVKVLLVYTSIRYHAIARDMIAKKDDKHEKKTGSIDDEDDDADWEENPAMEADVEDADDDEDEDEEEHA